MAGLASLVSKVGQYTKPDVKSAAYLITLDPQTDAPKFAATLQYFPETLTDSKSVNWQTKEIPGGSLPLYQWTSSGERSISFTAQFSADVDLLAKQPGNLSGVVGAGALLTVNERIKNAGQLRYNVDIRSAVAWLRSHLLPTYNSKGQAVAPSKLMLYIPYSGIGIAGGSSPVTVLNKDAIVCAMTQCEVSYEKFFPSGLPRIVSVSLGFAQLPQYRGLVNFPSNDDTMQQAFNPTLSVGATNDTFAGYQTAFADYVQKAQEPFK